jgi:putative ABC transport system permease protein
MIIGVVKDFNFKDLHVNIEPMIFQYGGDMREMYVRLAPSAIQNTIFEIEKIMKNYNPGAAFNYSFLSESFEKMYRSDIRTGRLFTIFAVIAILVSCLGLFGLVTFAAESKTREIGIRKVLGASVMGIVQMLLKEFLILVGVAMLIAFPLAYYWLDKMLQDFAYRIHLSWWMFALAGSITLALTLLTVTWKAVKAATANPVKAIKTE